MRGRLLHCLVAAFCLLMPAAQARVWRGVGAKPGQLNVLALPWSTAYKTKMTVNGVRNEVAVYAARFSQPVMTQLRNQFELQGAQVQLRETLSGASGVARWPDGLEARFLVMSPTKLPNYIIFIFYPELHAPKRRVPSPVNEYPGARITQTVTDDDTGVFMRSSTTFDSPEQVHSYYMQHLVANRWNIIAPARVANGSISGMAVYQRKNKICYVQVAQARDRSTHITLLVKSGAYK